MELLTRDNFREAVKQRDGYKCVICKTTDRPLDSHHIIERRLFDNGGYYIDNGATLCDVHHIEAEQTRLSCTEIRKAAGITTVVLPPHLYDDPEIEYDKWGNIVLSNGCCIKGELFYDESVQKILAEGRMLDRFMDYVKYPRTHHAPWSNPTKDDRMISDTSQFNNIEVVVTEKLDGENTSIYSDFIHARSLGGVSGEDHSFVKIIQARIGSELPKYWRICGENVYAEHSITYNNLESYFYMFSIWDEHNNCLSWDDTLEWAQLLNVETVPILYRGIYDENKIKSLWTPEKADKMEGYVIRTTSNFPFTEFRKWVMKFVRPSHVTTETHWRHKQIIPNKLKEGFKW